VGTCSLYGFYSYGPKTSGTPAWTYNIPNCYANFEVGGS
jgi:hypothetical protein